jgi:hypothetical protein
VVGTSYYFDFNASAGYSFPAHRLNATDDKVFLSVINAGTPYGNHVSISNLIPFAWAVNDYFIVSGTYEES